MGLDPMNAATSMGRPVFWTISAMGRMSFSTVRAAQYAVIFNLWTTISRASAVTCSTARASPGKSEIEGVDAERLHQVQDLQLLIDRRIADRRRLQTVT